MSDTAIRPVCSIIFSYKLYLRQNIINLNLRGAIIAAIAQKSINGTGTAFAVSWGDIKRFHQAVEGPLFLSATPDRMERKKATA